LTLISISCFAQQEPTVVSQEELKVMNAAARKKSSVSIDPKKELATIIEMTQLDPEKIPALEKLVANYAKAANPYRTNRKEKNIGILKELEIKYKFELQQLLGEDDYRKLLTVVRVN
jgi:hypothetical protein